MRHAALLVLVMLPLLPPCDARAGDASARARELERSAARRLAQGAPEQRQFARRELEEAHALVPGDSGLTRALGRLYVEGDMLLAARELALAELRRDPDGAEALFVLGDAWRREWLVAGEDVLRDRAIAAFSRALARRPGDGECAARLVPLLEDADECRPAFEVAQLAARARPGETDSWLLLGYAAQRAGEDAIAAQCFARALPALPREARRRYEDLTPLLWEPQARAYRALPEPRRHAFEQRFWRDLDPDPTTPENEGQLEFWARVTHARLLYGVNADDVWDTRAQVYIRFGRPEWVERNPLSALRAVPGGNWLVWSYPSLGMRVFMSALNPLGHYGALFRQPLTVAVRAFPDSLARHPELQGVAGGFAVFRRLPPGMEALPVRQATMRFASAAGGHLLGQAEIEAPPATRFDAVWVVFDSSGAEVARQQAPFVASACEPATLRAAAFAAELPPGHYRLAVRVDDGGSRRAVSSSDVTIPTPSSRLALSDLSVVCGPPAMSVGPGATLRLEPSTGLRPQQGPSLNVYLEIYHLRPDGDGERTFDYECTVRPLGGLRQSWLRRAFDPRPGGSPVLVSRRETTRGEVRRQFFTVPVGLLPAGRYTVEVRVTDVHSGDEAVASTEFTRD